MALRPASGTTSVTEATRANVLALNEVLTDEQAELVWVLPNQHASRFTVIFAMSAAAALEMVEAAMQELAEQGRKRGFPHQSLHNLRMRLHWAAQDTTQMSSGEHR